MIRQTKIAPKNEAKNMWSHEKQTRNEDHTLVLWTFQDYEDYTSSSRL